MSNGIWLPRRSPYSRETVAEASLHTQTAFDAGFLMTHAWSTHVIPYTNASLELRPLLASFGKQHDTAKARNVRLIAGPNTSAGSRARQVWR